MIRRHPILSVLALLLLLLLAWAWPNRAHLAAFPDIIGAYTAKEYCSCRYVSGNPAEYCAAYVEQYVPISAFHDDAERKRHEQDKSETSDHRHPQSRHLADRRHPDRRRGSDLRRRAELCAGNRPPCSPH